MPLAEYDDIAEGGLEAPTEEAVGGGELPTGEVDENFALEDSLMVT
jgi:hypothetical protein